jgi:hypothetical protein
MVKEFGPTVNVHRFRAAGMATPVVPARSDMAKNMCLPFADIDVLLKSILWFRVIVTEAFGTQARSDEIVTELNDVTLQWKETCTSIISHILGGVTLPGSETIEPLKAQKAEFVESTLPFGRRLLAAVHIRPPCGWVGPGIRVSRT